MLSQQHKANSSADKRCQSHTTTQHNRTDETAVALRMRRDMRFKTQCHDVNTYMSQSEHLRSAASHQHFKFLTTHFIA